MKHFLSDNLIVAQLVKKFPLFLVPEISLPCSPNQRQLGVLHGEELLAHSQYSSCRIIPCRLFATANSVDWQPRPLPNLQFVVAPLLGDN
jgi:hypothetical protein